MSFFLAHPVFALFAVLKLSMTRIFCLNYKVSIFEANIDKIFISELDLVQAIAFPNYIFQFESQFYQHTILLIFQVYLMVRVSMVSTHNAMEYCCT